jgi:ATP-dependent 26S proteasome regulatory subunit
MFFPVLQLLSFQFCKHAVCEVNFKKGITVLIIVNKLQFSFLSVRMLREELQLLQEQGSYVGEVVKPMDKKKVLVKVHPEGKFVVDLDKNIDINDVTANSRVALRNESYTLHKILPNKVCTITYETRDIAYVCS